MRTAATLNAREALYTRVHCTLSGAVEKQQPHDTRRKLRQSNQATCPGTPAHYMLHLGMFFLYYFLIYFNEVWLVYNAVNFCHIARRFSCTYVCVYIYMSSFYYFLAVLSLHSLAGVAGSYCSCAAVASLVAEHRV